MITVLVTIVLTLILICRLVTSIVYGSLLKDKDILPMLERNIKRGSELNMFDPRIINIGNLPFITNVPYDVIGYYHINDIGVIPRWSKAHKLIKAEFEKKNQERFKY